MQNEQTENSADGGRSLSTVELEMRQPKEVTEAIQKIAEATKTPQLQDEMVWMQIFCAVANCFNSERSVAIRWADEGLAEFRRRFR